MSFSAISPQCYVKMQISICDSSFESRAYFFSSFQTINDVVEKAKDLATENLSFVHISSSKAYAYDNLTGESLEGKQLLMRYYPENGCATIRVHFEDPLMRQVLSLD